MTYVVSDLHGNLTKFKKLLKEIHLTDDDTLYVLGDIVDYGEDSIPLLCDISMRYNVIPILGEHDLKAYRLLSALSEMLEGNTPEPEVISEMAEWMQDGGAPTIEGFKALDSDMREGVLEYLADMSLYEEVEAGGKSFLLVHAGIADFDEGTPLEDYMPEDFISKAQDANREYFRGVTLISGHVPTYELDGAERGRIYHGEYGYVIDCGAAYGEPLGAMRLEDGKKFYIQ